MKLGINKSLFRFLSMMILSFSSGNLLWAESGHDNTEKTLAVLQREAYYHFFLEDYLNAATYLKMLERKTASVGDFKALHETRVLLGSLYMAWEMDRPATKMFTELVTHFPPGKERNQLFLVLQKMQYDRTLYRSALNTYGHFASRVNAEAPDQATYLAGMSHYALKTYHKSAEALERIHADSAYFPYAQFTLAKTHIQMNDPDRALDHLRSLSRLDPEGAPVSSPLIEKSRLTWGQLLFEEKRYKAAQAVLATFPEKSPFYPDALFVKGWAELKDGKDLKALLSFQDLIADQPNHPYALEAMTALGHGYRKLKAYPEAVKRYGTAMRLYSEKEGEIRNLQETIQDTVRLTSIINADRENGNSSLPAFAVGDRSRSWIRQYKQLSKLIAYLDRRLSDMDVFQVMVDHRETVFRNFLPIVDRTLDEKPLTTIGRRVKDLEAHVDGAIRTERFSAMASPEEAALLEMLNDALRKSASLGAHIDRLQNTHQQDPGLAKSWRNTDRLLKIIQGEMVWKLTTGLPGRADELRRRLRAVTADMRRMNVSKAQLTGSFYAMERKIARFRIRVASIRSHLTKMRDKALHIQSEMLPSLQTLLLDGLHRRLNQVRMGSATAELHQIRILDLHGTTEQP
ncbi:MAG: tetratricopeptide repeat protein [Nitrospiria bacterium]